jgi:parvulin-like peptidyl-prolyl isomerase
MIEQLKKNLNRENLSLKSVTAMVLFGAIVLVFVFFGMPGRNSGTTAIGSAAVVNATIISVADLRQETQRLEQFYASFMGGGDMGAQRQFLTERALENLISSEIVAQQAHSAGIHSTDSEIRDFIVKDITVFQKDGQFQREYYQNYLSATRSSAGEFETKIRKDRQNQRSRRLMEIAFQPVTMEMSKQKDLRNTKLNIAFVKFEKEQMDSNAAISDSEANTSLANADFVKKAEGYFKANAAKYNQEEQVKAQHILIKAEGADTTAALAKANEIKGKITKENFSQLAGQFSEDPGSKTNGGDLGFFGRGRMVPEFEKAAFELKVGEISEPIKSSFGYHIIKVNEKKAASTPAFDEVKIKVAKALLAEEKIEAKTKSIEEALAKGDESSVESELKVLGAKWEETGLFDLNTEILPKLSSQAATQAAFELTKEKPLLNRLVRDGGQKYILKLKEQKNDTANAEDKTLLQQVTRERSGDVFNNWIESARKNSKIQKNPQVFRQN